MPKLRLENDKSEMLCVFVEPIGEDFWIAPSQSLVFTAASSEPEVDCIWHAQGVSVWMGDADAYGFVVTTEAGDVVECGYQRPPGAFHRDPAGQVVTSIAFSAEEAERTLALCDAVRSRPGMWIAHFDWITADAFWSGYLLAIDPNALSDFRAWGLEHIGAPDSNTSPVFELQRRHGLPADNAVDASWTRARATEVAALVCDVVAAYVRARSL